MFISRKKWFELQKEIEKLKSGQKIRGVFDEMNFFGCSCTTEIPLNQAVELILDFFDLKINIKTKEKSIKLIQRKNRKKELEELI